MSARLKKKKERSSSNSEANTKQINTAFNLYDKHLDKLYRELGRKTDSIEWIEQNYPLLGFENISNIEKADSWLLPADNSRTKELTMQQDKSLLINIALLKTDSFYLQTGNMDINQPPLDKSLWNVNAGYKYKVLITADYGDVRPDCAAFIIQYDNDKRIAHKFQQIYNGTNTIEFETALDAKHISIALRFKGEGKLSLKPIKVLSEEMLPIGEFNIREINDPDHVERIFEMKSTALSKTFNKRIYSLPDSPKNQEKNINELESKLAEALFDKRNLEQSLEYRIGKTVSSLNSSKFLGLLSLPKKIVKIRAAKRKGKFIPPTLNQNLRHELLESVGIFNEDRPEEEITWPPFEPRAKLNNQNINIVSISDQFTYECFRYEANFIQLTKKNWKSEIDNANPAMFFIESAWNGNNGEWTYTMASYKKHLGDPLREAIKYCNSKNIPVIFWNKEDPTNYEVFIDVAADCDYIFTTDGGIVNKYIDRVGHNNVYPLAFAAQPAIHNPIREKRKQLPEYEVCFAGSWYNNGHDTRRVQTEIVLDGALDHELHIYDRMLHAKQHRESRIFPAKYQPFISGSLNYDQMVTAYRQYKVFLNINTVQDSPTMFSRRVFEILACATPVISTRSIGMENMLEGHTFTVENNTETKNHLSKLLNDDLYRKTVGHQAARHVLNHHTYRNRLEYIFNKVGISSVETFAPLVTMIMCTNRPENINLMIENYERQDHKNCELIVVINKNKTDLQSIEKKLSGVTNSKLIHVDEKESLGNCLNEGVIASKGDIIAKMDDDDFYGKHYISDSVNAMNFSGADVVGKDSHFAYIESKDELVLIRNEKDNRFSDFIIGASLVIKREVLDVISFHDRSKGEDSQFLKDCKDKGLIVYSSDMFNYITVRRKDLSSHTWQIADDDFTKKAKHISKGFNKKLVNI